MVSSDRILPSICVEVVDVDVDTIGRVPSHKGEALGSQAIGARSIGACIPFAAREVNPVIVGDGIETASNCGSARCCCAVGVIIICIDVGMVVKVLIQVG